MTKKYFDKLNFLISELNLSDDLTNNIEIKHFFSGAAVYVNDNICISWSPVGLSFKLQESKAEKLIQQGKAQPLKYFPKGHIKKGYALFSNPDEKKTGFWKKYLIESIELNEKL